MFGNSRIYLEPRARAGLLGCLCFFLVVPLVWRILQASSYRFCDTSGPCIFNLRFHGAQDTALYLKGAKTHVLLVEADPAQLKAARELFPHELSDSRLNLLNLALVAPTQPATVPFFQNTANISKSSLVEHSACQSPQGKPMPAGDRTYCRKVSVETSTCSKLVVQYGTPSYMKIDMDYLDGDCINSMNALKLSERPKYLSVGLITRPIIDALANLGYSHFKMVNGVGSNSGVWGEDAEDILVGRKWISLADALARFGGADAKVIASSSDIHAKRA